MHSEIYLDANATSTLLPAAIDAALAATSRLDDNPSGVAATPLFVIAPSPF